MPSFDCKPKELASWILDALRRNAFDITPRDTSSFVYLDDRAERIVLQVIQNVIERHTINK